MRNFHSRNKKQKCFNNNSEKKDVNFLIFNSNKNLNVVNFYFSLQYNSLWDGGTDVHYY